MIKSILISIFIISSSFAHAQNEIDFSSFSYTSNLQLSNATPRFIFLWYQNDSKNFKFDLGWRSFQWREDIGDRFENNNEVSFLLRFKFQ